MTGGVAVASTQVNRKDTFFAVACALAVLFFAGRTGVCRCDLSFSLCSGGRFDRRRHRCDEGRDVGSGKPRGKQDAGDSLGADARDTEWGQLRLGSEHRQVRAAVRSGALDPGRADEPGYLSVDVAWRQREQAGIFGCGTFSGTLRAPCHDGPAHGWQRFRALLAVGVDVVDQRRVLPSWLEPFDRPPLWRGGQGQLGQVHRLGFCQRRRVGVVADRFQKVHVLRCCEKGNGCYAGLVAGSFPTTRRVPYW